jgi:CheY-like chemotaxis protein
MSPSDHIAHPSILIAGLSRDAREMYQEFFLWVGWRVTLAADSAVAVELAVVEQPDIVATSNRLRPRDGLQLCEQLHADPRTAHIPVVILTTATNNLDRRRARMSGCATLLIQPTLPKRLLTQARRLIARAQRAKDGVEGAPNRRRALRTKRLISAG